MSLRSRVFSYLKTLPLVRTWRDQRHYRYFLSEHGFGSFYGVFATYSEALARLPTSGGYDNEELADEFIPRMDRLFAYDYPVLFWLDRAISQGARSIFDIGGAVGVHFHAYRKVLTYPEDLTWCVSETPAMVRVGREIAASRGADGLSFIESLPAGDIRADILLSEGSLQYIDNARPRQLLEHCQKRPSHIILNKLPLYDGDDFICGQNIGKNSYSPFQVYNRSRYITEVESMGYRLIGSWGVPERVFYLPGHPEKLFTSFSGMYFKIDTAEK